MSYFDPKAETRLETYADTVVIEKEGNISYLSAVRMGGYPESVKGMSEAIYGGGTVSMTIDGTHITAYSRLKQYRKEFSHDGIYAESTLLINDEEQRTDQDQNRYHCTPCLSTTEEYQAFQRSPLSLTHDKEMGA